MAIFAEHQHLVPEQYQTAVVGLIAVASVIGGVYGATGTSTTSLLFSIGAATIGVFVMLYLMYRLFQVPELSISVSETDTVLKFAPFDSKQIPTSEITDVETYEHDPGWGIGIKRLPNGAKQYRMYGEPVKINEQNGPGILVTTQQPDELVNAIEHAK